jgi:hypothetical protein
MRMNEVGEGSAACSPASSCGRGPGADTRSAQPAIAGESGDDLPIVADEFVSTVARFARAQV